MKHVGVRERAKDVVSLEQMASWPFAAGYQVSSTKIMVGPGGERFVARGVQMFDYLFVSFEARANYNFRTIYSPAGKGAAHGISEPTYYAPTQYVSAQHVDQQMRLARQSGANLIRLGVEPAMMYATVPYVDPSNSVEYPSDPDMLDVIIDAAERYGMVVQLQNSNDFVGTSDNIAFLKWLAARYFSRRHVWINPANEPNGMAGGGADVGNATVWAAEMRQYVLALREDIPGRPAGTKFLNPVAIDPPSYAYRLDLIAATLASDAAFSADPNLVINIHYYPMAGESSFRGARLTTDLTRWVNYLSTHCIMIGEAGIDNFAGRHDPNLDPGVPSVNLTAWAQMQAAVSDFLAWCDEQCRAGTLQGVIGHMWKAYIPGMALHDDNTMRRQDGTWTTWGTLFRDKCLAPRQSALADNVVTNAKLADMAQSTLKGRAAAAGTGDPADLTVAQVLAMLTGLTSAVGHASIGTPLFQAEALDGVRGAAMFIAHQANAAYVGFYNKGASNLAGLISGNGSTGLTYGTTSDARLKKDIEALDADYALEQVLRMRPVLAGWKEHPDAPREPMFLAHELQEILPSAVAGEAGATAEFEGQQVIVPQTVDYGRASPLIVAAVHALARRVERLEQALSLADERQ